MTFKKILLLILFLISHIFAIAQVPNPMSIDSLKLWLAGDSVSAISGKVAQWYDKSGHSNHALQNTPAYRPTFISSESYVNNCPVLQFDGSDDFFTGTTIAGLNNSSITVFVVAKGENQAGNAADFFAVNYWQNGFTFHRRMTGGAPNCISIYNNNQVCFSANGTLPATGFNYSILAGRKNYGVQTDLFINGTNVATSTNGTLNGTFTNTNYRIGNSQDFQYLKGNIAEILVYKKALSTPEINTVIAYLNYKYGKKINLGPDLEFNFCNSNVQLDAGTGFTNYLWNTGAQTQIISINSIGKYWVSAKNNLGLTVSDTVNVIGPNLNLNFSDSIICFGDNILLHPLLNDFSKYTFLWSTGSTDTSIIVTTSGKYWVKVFDAFQCYDYSDTLNIVRVDSLSYYMNLGNNTNLCTGNLLKVNLGNYHPSGTLNYHWATGETTDKVTINNTGFYKVTVSSNKCTNSDSIFIIVPGIAPTVSFQTSPTCHGSNSELINNTTLALPDSVTHWLWSFGNGDSAFVKNPLYIYSQTGNYSISLKAISNSGCTNSLTKSITIRPKPLPLFNASLACINNAYTFQDLSQPPSGNSITSWLWHFGDTTTSSQQNPLHTYNSTGTYNISLRVTASNACTDSLTKSLQVVSSFPNPQTFSLIAPNNNAYINLIPKTFSWNISPNASHYVLQIADNASFYQVLHTYTTTQTQLSVSLSNTTDTLYWRVIAFNICNDYIVSDVRKFTVFNIATISGLKLWLMGDSVTLSNGRVSQWKDVSGNDNHATQSDNSKRPVLIQEPLLNNKPTLNFDGINDILTGTTITGINNSSITIFVIAKGESQTGNGADFLSVNTWQNGFTFHRRMTAAAPSCLSIYNNGQTIFSTNGTLPATGFNYSLLSARKNFSVQTDMYINGLNIGNSTNSALNGVFTNTNYIIGNSAEFQYLKGNIAEIILYTNALSDIERKAVENYLYQKYAPQVNLGPDINIAYGFCDTVIKAGNYFTSYHWSNSATTPSIIVNKSGTYAVTVTDVFGFSSSDSIKVTYPYNPAPANVHSLCFGDTLLWQTGLGQGYNITWNDNSHSKYKKIFQPGSYFYTATDTNSPHCSYHSETVNISSIDSLSYYMTLGNDTSLCAGNQLGVHLGNYHPSGALNYHWSTNETTDKITITNTGLYSVTVSNNNLCSVTDSIFITISGIMPIVSFSADTICLGVPTSFTDFSSVPLPNHISSWDWHFEPGAFSSIPSPDYTFTNYGIYNVMLKVTSTDGCNNTLSQSIKVKQRPKALFDVTSACVNFPYQFIDLSTTPFGDSLTAWLWNFGNGQMTAEQNPAFGFNQAGNFNISLQVTASNGCSDTSSQNLNVVTSAPPPGNFSLIYPIDSFVSYLDTIDFSWYPGNNAFSYTFEVATDSLFNSVISIIETASTSIHLGVPSGPSLIPYYWRVAANSICYSKTYSGVRIFKYFNPLIIPDLKLWLIGDSVGLNGNYINLWHDLSGNNNDAIQLNNLMGPQYIQNALNLKPALKFDGINDLLNGTLIQGIDTSSITIFVVAMGEAQSGNGADFFSINTWQDGFTFHRRMTTGAPNCLSLYNNGQAIYSANGTLPATGFNYLLLSAKKHFGVQTDLFINGLNAGNSTNNTLNSVFTNTNYKIGNSTGFQYLKGNIAEIILYTSTLSDNLRETIEAYLFSKYEPPPVNLGPDINIHYSLCDIVLSASERYKNYLWSTGDTTSSINVSESGTYWISATDHFGRISKDTVEVFKPTFHVNDTLICMGNSIVVDPGGGNAYQYNWNTGATTQSVVISSQGNYSVTISDDHGCTKESPFSVSLDHYANTASLGPDKTICSGAPIGLTNGAAETVSYLWSTGGTLPSINITTAGHYSIEAWNARGCHMRDTVNITLWGFIPVADFTSDSVCIGTLMNFSDNSSENPSDHVIYWYWIFGPNDNAIGQSTAKSYLTPGYHFVTHIVKTNKLCFDTIVKKVKVYDKPIVHFDQTFGCKGVPVDFYENSSLVYGNVNSWYWSFGDGDTSSQQSPHHSYNTEGLYDVSLTAKSNFNCASDTLKRTINIRLGPDVDYIYSSACFGEVIQFTNQTFPSPGEQIIDQSWDFGDGNQSVLINPDHIFIDSAGIYNVALTAKSVNGCIITKTKPVKVNENPIANFIAGNPCTQVPFKFFDASTVSNDSIVHWLWDFGNVDTDTLKNPLFSFPDPGVYTVILNVTTSAGCKNYFTSDIEVYPSPIADFTLSPHYGLSPLTVNFTNNSTNAYSYFWNFGDNIGQSWGINPTYTYNQNGIYTVELTATSILGCQNSAFDVVNVIPTVIDLAVDKVVVDIVNDYVKVKATLKNYGTQALEKFDLIATGSNGTTFKEHWQGNLLPGHTIDYEFNAQFLLSNQKLDYVCVKGVTLELQNDIDLSNNESCQAITTDFTVINAFPNPATHEVNLNFIIPADDNVKVSLYNSIGQLVGNIYDGQLPKGLNRFTENLIGLSSGIYYFVVYYHDQQLVAKFAKF